MLRTFLEMRCKPQMIMDGKKFLSMVVENLDSPNFLSYFKEHAQTILPHTQLGVLSPLP